MGAWAEHSGEADPLQPAYSAMTGEPPDPEYARRLRTGQAVIPAPDSEVLVLYHDEQGDERAVSLSEPLADAVRRAEGLGMSLGFGPRDMSGLERHVRSRLAEPPETAEAPEGSSWEHVVNATTGQSEDRLVTPDPEAGKRARSELSDQMQAAQRRERAVAWLRLLARSEEYDGASGVTLDMAGAVLDILGIPREEETREDAALPDPPAPAGDHH